VVSSVAMEVRAVTGTAAASPQAATSAQVSVDRVMRETTLSCSRQICQPEAYALLKNENQSPPDMQAPP
jgi:hypothetical protein